MLAYHLTSTGHNLNYLPQYIASRHGFFQEQGLNVSETIPTPWDGVLDALADDILTIIAHITVPPSEGEEDSNLLQGAATLPHLVF